MWACNAGEHAEFGAAGNQTTIFSALLCAVAIDLSRSFECLCSRRLSALFCDGSQQETLRNRRGCLGATQELSGQSASIARLPAGQCRCGTFGDDLRYMLLLTFALDCAECCRRAAVPFVRQLAGLSVQWPHAAIIVPGVDRNAQQAQAGTAGQQRRNQWRFLRQGT